MHVSIYLFAGKSIVRNTEVTICYKRICDYLLIFANLCIFIYVCIFTKKKIVNVYFSFSRDSAGAVPCLSPRDCPLCLPLPLCPHQVSIQHVIYWTDNIHGWNSPKKHAPLWRQFLKAPLVLMSPKFLLLIENHYQKHQQNGSKEFSMSLLVAHRRWSL